MLQLHNKTPFEASIALMPNESGINTIYTMASATFVWQGQWQIAKEQLPPTEADQYLAEPGFSSIVRPSEYHLGKPSSDIIVIGDACAPNGQKIRAMDVCVQVGDLSKTVRVFGDRFWHNGDISQPEYFERMPIVYERAYGGVCVDDNNQVISAEERNPVGVGFLGKYHPSQFDNTILPNIEDPQQLITRLKDQPAPAGFGVVAPNWQPRVQLAGTYDEQWQLNRAPFLPINFDKRFFNCASPGLIYPEFLQGGEQVTISGMHPDGDVQFPLPIVNLHAHANMSAGKMPVSLNLGTVLIEPNDLRITLAWHGAFVAPKNIATFENIELVLGR